MKLWILIGVGIVVVLIGAFLVVNKVSPVGWGLWGQYNTSSGVALKGYDPVAYFTDRQPALGKTQFSYDWGGARWLFSTAENRDLFSGNPESYAPQCGGFCSFAVSKGFTADISPDAWHIHDGKLYVFADQDVRDSWVAGVSEGTLATTESNWAKR
jgi:YHS domain-containing protein